MKKQFEEWGVTQCELGYEGCFVNNFLGFAHSKRRRFVHTEEDWGCVLLACQSCHEILDRKPHRETERVVLEGVQERGRRLAEVW